MCYKQLARGPGVATWVLFKLPMQVAFLGLVLSLSLNPSLKCLKAFARAALKSVNHYADDWQMY